MSPERLQGYIKWERERERERERGDRETERHREREERESFWLSNKSKQSNDFPENETSVKLKIP